MLIQDEHAQTALEFLEKADRHYAEGDQIQASEKLWGAAAQAIMAVSIERGWPYTSHPAMKRAAERLADEQGDPLIASNSELPRSITGTSTTCSWRTRSGPLTSPRSTIWWHVCWRCAVTAGGMGLEKSK